jgi:hypothetical protein
MRSEIRELEEPAVDRREALRCAQDDGQRRVGVTTDRRQSWHVTKKAQESR